MRLWLFSHDPCGRNLACFYKLQVSSMDPPSHIHHFLLEHARSLKSSIFLLEGIYRRANAPAEELDKKKLSITVFNVSVWNLSKVPLEYRYPYVIVNTLISDFLIVIYSCIHLTRNKRVKKEVFLIGINQRSQKFMWPFSLTLPGL